MKGEKNRDKIRRLDVGVYFRMRIAKSLLKERQKWR